MKEKNRLEEPIASVTVKINEMNMIFDIINLPKICTYMKEELEVLYTLIRHKIYENCLIDGKTNLWKFQKELAPKNVVI